MRILIFFVVRSKSIWWDFKEADFIQYEENSLKRPIFAVCTSTHCPHCKGLPDMLKSYSNMLGNNTPIVFTNINCQRSTVCNKIGVKGVPSFVLIRSTKPKFWVQTYDRNMLGWNKFLQTHIKGETFEIQSDEKLNELIRNTYEGGTTFYLQIGNGDDSEEIFRAYQKQSVYYHVTGCTFAYRRGEKETKITAYTSIHCSVTENITAKTMQKFIEQNYYSDFYHFDSNELYDKIYENKTTMLFVGENPLGSAQRDAIDSLSKKYCNKITFGWADKSADIHVDRFAGKTSEDDDFYFIVNPIEKCFSLGTGNPAETDLEDFIAKSTEEPQCKKIPALRRSGKKKEYTKETLYVAAGIGIVLFCGYFIYQIFNEGPLKLE
jgi:thiol-disulfide isomerase/thioredoxin/preprotein translocase subunit Sss1